MEGLAEPTLAGDAAPTPCPMCATPVAFDATFCGKCGRRASPLPAPPSWAKKGLIGPRRKVVGGASVSVVGILVAVVIWGSASALSPLDVAIGFATGEGSVDGIAAKSLLFVVSALVAMAGASVAIYGTIQGSLRVATSDRATGVVSDARRAVSSQARATYQQATPAVAAAKKQAGDGARRVKTDLVPQLGKGAEKVKRGAAPRVSEGKETATKLLGQAQAQIRQRRGTD